jgi:hypothetical protein
LTAGEAKNVDNAVVLARLFNEASGQKAPSKKHGLFISRPLTSSAYHHNPSRHVKHDFTAHPVVKTHLLPGQLPLELRDLPAVYLIRDGRDALVSLAHYRKDIVAPGTDFDHNLLEATLAQGGSFFGGWSENVRQWSEKAAIIIRFEDLITDPIHEVEKLRAIINLPSPAFTKLPTFKSQRDGRSNYGASIRNNFSAERAKKHFRSGKIGGWEIDVTPELLRVINSVHGPTLRKFGYADEGLQNQDLKQQVFDHVGIIKFDPPENREQVDLKVSADKIIILNNRRTIFYEKIAFV